MSDPNQIIAPYDGGEFDPYLLEEKKQFFCSNSWLLPSLRRTKFVNEKYH
ncbi:MAG: hypothetical protein MJK14_19150 [Rivularia sp. ALOHA_DT_140]|nr:hypothetical protein [Rivularia sp. ALOHA_DT_140]